MQYFYVYRQNDTFFWLERHYLHKRHVNELKQFAMHDMLSALLSKAYALNFFPITAACADLMQTFSANHGWVAQKASWNSSLFGSHSE